MDRGTAALLTAFVGTLIAFQAPLNGGLGKAIGSAQATFVSFLTGTVLLLVVSVFARGGLGRISDVGEVGAWYYLTGGLLGAAYVGTALVTVATLGAGGVTAATIAGQLTASMVVDHYGWFGVEPSRITVVKLAGVALLAAGTYLIVRD